MALLGDWSQTVRIGVVTNARVAGMTINEESRQPVTRLTFNVENAPATATTFNAVLLNEEVEVTHTHQGYSRTWLARITDIRLERGANFTQARVTADTVETVARRRRVFGEYKGPLSQVVANVWGDWGGFIAGSVVVDPGLDEEVEITPSWESLFDVIDELARRGDYAWRVDPFNDQMEFFDPLNQPGDTIDQSADDLIAKSLTIHRSSEDIVNSVLASGWVYRDITVTAKPGECQHSIHSEEVERLATKDQWEFVGAVVTKDFMAGGAGPDGDRELKVRESGWLTFEPALVPRKQASEEALDGLDFTPYTTFHIGQILGVTVKADVTFRKLAQTVIDNQPSIDKFGLREGEPITEEGGQTIEESRQRARQVIDARAWPTIEVDAELTRMGPRADTLARVITQEPAMDKELFVESVTHSVRGNELDVEVRLSKPDADTTTAEG